MIENVRDQIHREKEDRQRRHEDQHDHPERDDIGEDQRDPLFQEQG